MIRTQALSHNTDLVGNVESVLLSRDHDVGLLEAVGSDEGVHSGDLDAVEFLASFLDHWLVGSSVNNEHEGVAVLNGLDGALSAQGVLDDGVLVKGRLLLHAGSRVLGLAGESEGLGSSEGGVSPNLVLSDSVASLLHGGGGSLGLSLHDNRRLRTDSNGGKERHAGAGSKEALTDFFGIVYSYLIK